jgi:hypothetical protein
MRLVQVQDFIDGAGWYNLTQARVNPPQGLEMHWSRLPDLPLAAVILMIEHLGIDRQIAIALTARAVPPLIGIGFFFAFVWATAPLVRPTGIIFAGLVSITLWLPLTQFAAGRVDHHGWQLLFAALTSGTVIRLILNPYVRGPALLGGCVGTLGLWVGAEAIPWIGMAAAALTLNWIRHGRPGGNVLALFGVTLALTSTLLLPLVVPSVRLSTPACDAFSIVSLGLAGAVALLGLGAAAADRLMPLGNPLIRLVLSLIIGALALAFLLVLFPECQEGPFSQVSPEIGFWIQSVRESQSLAETLKLAPGDAAASIALPALSLAVALTAAARSKGVQRTLWLVLLTWSAAGIVLLLWQIRTAFLANLYAGMSLAWLAACAGQRAEGASRSFERILLSAVVPITVAVLPVIAYLGAESTPDGNRLKTTPACDLKPVVSALNDHRMGDPRLIAADIDLGPELILMTPHLVLAAPYHRNTDGLLDIRRFLLGDVFSAAEVVRRRGVDVIVLCPQDQPAGSEGGVPFRRQLLAGDIPLWLLKLPVDSEVNLFVVDKNKLSAP